MIREPALFPYPGSWALWMHNGRALAVRIQLRRGDEAMISIPSYYRVASGDRRVPVSELLDATPLTQADQAELRRLSSAIAGRKRPRKADIDRADALRRRAIDSRLLQEQLAKLSARYAPEAAAARRAA